MSEPSAPIEHLTSLQAIVDAEALVGLFHDEQHAEFGALLAQADRHTLAALILYSDSAIRMASTLNADTHSSVRRQLRTWLTDRFTDLYNDSKENPHD
jgi:uncharacterized protein with PIN domain